MFESIGRSFELVQTSWNILMDDKKLLVFPVLSGIVTIAVILTFILPLLVSGAFMGMSRAGPVAYYGLLFLFYVVSYFVVIFFNTALISCVNAKLNGKDMTVGEGLSNSAKHLPAIIGWAVLSATVGLVLHLLEERAGFIGDIVLAIIGGVWSLVTYFVVPVLILEDKGVVDSLKESVSLIKKTWGESIVGSAGMAIIFVIIGVLAALVVLATMFLGNVLLFGAALALFLIFIVLLAVVYYAMQGIFVTALYTYAKTGSVPSSFNKDLIENAFAPRQAGQ
jgi:ABC-type multidrug transport system fused ATPase/permease subunit